MANFNDGMFIQISADVKDALSKLGKLDATVESVLKEVKINADVKSLDEAQTAFDKLKKAAQEAASASRSLGDSLKGVGSQLTTTANGYINAVKGVFDKIKGFAAAGAAGIGATLKSAFDIGGGFESSMTAVKVISGATAEQFNLLTAKARELGATLPITAQDAADAMTVMAQRGTAVKDILASVTDVTNLAISQSMSLADAADILGSAMNNFGIAATEASRVTDIFNNASNQSALTMEKLGEGLKYAATTANAAGMSLEQTMAAMEVLANAGLDGSQIGTGLSAVILKIASSTEILGVKTRDVQGNMRALADIFTDLSQRGVTLSEMGDEFGKVNAKSALSLANSAESLKTFERNLKSLGSTQSAVVQQMDTWQNTVAGLGSALESVRLTVFDQLKEKAKGTVNSLSEMVRAFDTWLAKTGAAQKVLKAFMDGLGVGLPSLKSFKDALAKFNLDVFLQKIKNLGDTVRHVFDTLKTFASIAVTAFNAVYAVIGKHTGVIAEFAQKLLGISYAAKLVGGALSGTGGLLNLTGNLYDKLKPGVGVLSNFGKALMNMNTTLATSAAAASTFWTALAGGTVITGIIAGIAALNSKLKDSADAFQELRDSLSQQHKLEFDLKLKESARAQFDKLAKELKTGFEKVSSASILDEELIKRFEELRKDLQDKTWKQVTNYVAQFNSKLSETEKILAVTDKALEKFRPQIEKALGGDTKAFEALPEQLKIIFEAFKKGINEEGRDIGLEFLNGVKDALKDTWNVIEDQLEGKNIKLNMTPLEEFTERAADDVGKILDDLEAQLSKSFELLGDSGDYKLTVNADVSDAIGAVDELAKALSEKIGIGSTAARVQIEKMVQSLASRGDKVAQLMVDSFKKPEKEVESLSEKFKDFVEYLGASPAQFMPALKQMLSNIQAIDPATGRVSEAFKKAYAAVKEFASMTLDKLKSQIDSISSAVKKGLLDKKALEAPTKQAEVETWFNLKPKVNWNALKGAELDRARAEMVSKFMDSIEDIDDAMVKDLQAKIDDLRKNNWSDSLLNEKIFKDLDEQMKKLARDTKITTEVQQKISVPGVEQFPKAIADFTAKQSGIMQQSQQSASQISDAGTKLVTAMSNLQRAIELNTNAKSSGSNGGGATVDTTRLEAICSSIIGAISEVKTDVQGHSGLLAAIQNAIAGLNASTTNNYNYDLTINQTGFSVQSKADAASLARQTVSAMKSGLGIATA